MCPRSSLVVAGRSVQRRVAHVLLRHVQRHPCRNRMRPNRFAASSAWSLMLASRRSSNQSGLVTLHSAGNGPDGIRESKHVHVTAHQSAFAVRTNSTPKLGYFARGIAAAVEWFAP
jgi:hypothetical protein